VVAQVTPGQGETLFEEWYVERHEREAKMKKIVAVAENGEISGPAYAVY
jgi:hypothetical protein